MGESRSSSSPDWRESKLVTERRCLCEDVDVAKYCAEGGLMERPDC